MAYLALQTSCMREGKKCFKNSQKKENQNLCKKVGVTEKVKDMVPMDRVQLSQGCQLLSPK